MQAHYTYRSGKDKLGILPVIYQLKQKEHVNAFFFHRIKDESELGHTIICFLRHRCTQKASPTEPQDRLRTETTEAITSLLKVMLLLVRNFDMKNPISNT